MTTAMIAQTAKGLTKRDRNAKLVRAMTISPVSLWLEPKLCFQVLLGLASLLEAFLILSQLYHIN
jgi:hypothetical protein